MLMWTKETQRLGGLIYVAQGTEADSEEDVELTVEKTEHRGRPWEVRAAGGIVGYSKTLTEGKALAEKYCTNGLSNTGNEYQ